MTKKGFIWLSITLFILTLIAVLFGFVFCVRTQSVKIVDKSILLVDNNEIIKTADIESGTSIFLIDKQQAINNIEAKYPHIKVVQIKTTGLTTIEICVRARFEMYYAEANGNYYLLDEDLKVLNIIEKTDTSFNSNNLIKIQTDDIDIPETTKLCDFVGTDHQRYVAYELFVSMYTTVCKQDGGNKVYFTRDDIRATLEEIDFEYHTSYSRLIISTSYGVKLDIENPENNTQEKINICFSTIDQFVKEGNNKEKSGTIKIFFDGNKEMKCVYIPNV